MSQPAISLRLTADIRLTDKPALVVRYRLENESREEVCVFDRFYRTLPSGERILDDDLAYVLFEDGRVIHVTRSAMRIPDGLKVESPEVPYARVVGPGQSVEGQVVVPVPVREVRPYQEPVDGTGGVGTSFRSVYFTVGVFRKTADLQLRSLPRLSAGSFSVSYKDAMARQELVKSPRVDLDVPVLRPDPAASRPGGGVRPG